jgi:hypothetical protein
VPGTTANRPDADAGIAGWVVGAGVVRAAVVAGAGVVVGAAVVGLGTTAVVGTGDAVLLCPTAGRRISTNAPTASTATRTAQRSGWRDEVE